jgi:cytochrome c-type biogenesis protein CcmH
MFWLRLALLAAVPAGAPAQTPADSAALEAEVRDIAAQIRCPVCLNLSIADTPSELGRDMRALIRDRLRQGENREQVLQYFVARYGEWILMEPPARGVNLLVWLLPAVLVLGGGVLLVVHVRRWVGQTRGVTPEGEPVSDEYLRKVEQELARGEHD